MKYFRINFEKGESFTAILLTEEAPETCEIFWEALPFSSVVQHSRWSGREVNWSFSPSGTPKRENQTIYTSLGEVCYWRNWRSEEVEGQPHVMAVYYGAEVTRGNVGEEPVNVFAQIDYSEVHLLKEVGERIWLKGEERIYCEKLED